MRIFFFTFWIRFMFIKNRSETAFTKEQKFEQQKIHFNTSVKLRKSKQKIISGFSGRSIKHMPRFAFCT